MDVLDRVVPALDPRDVGASLRQLQQYLTATMETIDYTLGRHGGELNRVDAQSIAQVQADLGAVRSQASALSSQLGAARAQLEALAGTVGGQGETLAGQGARLDALEQSVQALEARVAALEGGAE